MNTQIVSQFVGEPIQIRGRLHPDPDSVLVVLKNGRPVRVITPGRLVSRFRRAPLTGDAQVCQVNTGNVSLKQIVQNVASQDGHYVAPKVPLEYTVRLGVRRDYAALTSFIELEGTSFALSLVQRLQVHMEALLRQEFRSRTHKVLFEAPDVLFNNAMPRVVDGILEVTQARLTADVDWDPLFLQARTADAVTIGITTQGDVDIHRENHDQQLALLQAEHRAEIARVEAQHDARLRLEKLDLLAPVAAAYGISVEFILDPQRRETLEGRQFEAIMAMLQDNHLRSRISRDPSLLQSILDVAGGGALEPSQLERIDSHLRLADTSMTTGGPAKHPATAAALGPSGAVDDVDFTIERKLHRAWRAAGGDPGIVGISGAQGDNRATVIVVARDRAPEVPKGAVARFAAIYRVQDIDVVATRAMPPEDFAAQWVTRLAGTSADVSVRTELTPGDALNIAVGGSARAAKLVVDAANAPDSSDLAALESLLPFASISIDLDERQG